MEFLFQHNAVLNNGAGSVRDCKPGDKCIVLTHQHVTVWC